MASTSGRKLNIVVEGCCHGELPKIYASVLKTEQVRHEPKFFGQVLKNDSNSSQQPWLCGYPCPVAGLRSSEFAVTLSIPMIRCACRTVEE